MAEMPSTSTPDAVDAGDDDAGDVVGSQAHRAHMVRARHACCSADATRAGRPATEPADGSMLGGFAWLISSGWRLTNPTLKQAAAQFEAALNRSHQAGLYPNPVLGYVQDQIGSFSESMPTNGGFAVRGKPSPGDNVGAFIQWQLVTAGKLRLSRAKFAEEASAARWQAIAQELRVLNAVRIGYFEVLAAERLIAAPRDRETG